MWIVWWPDPGLWIAVGIYFLLIAFITWILVSTTLAFFLRNKEQVSNVFWKAFLYHFRNIASVVLWVIIPATVILVFEDMLKPNSEPVFFFTYLIWVSIFQLRILYKKYSLKTLFLILALFAVISGFLWLIGVIFLEAGEKYSEHTIESTTDKNWQDSCKFGYCPDYKTIPIR